MYIMYNNRGWNLGIWTRYLVHVQMWCSHAKDGVYAQCRKDVAQF